MSPSSPGSAKVERCGNVTILTFGADAIRNVRGVGWMIGTP